VIKNLPDSGWENRVEVGFVIASFREKGPGGQGPRPEDYVEVLRLALETSVIN
jgi:hypothetical protein